MHCLAGMKECVLSGLSALPASASRGKAGSFKVCVCGGAGGIGQPLSMLMARNQHVSELCVYDLTLAMVPAAGVAADLAHLERKSKVVGFALDKDDKPVDKLEECLTGCHLVLVPAGMPRRPGMTRADLLGVNAGIAKNIVEACAKFCPNAVVGLIVNPVNSVVPAMCELYKKAGLNPRKICGVTSLDIVRANKFVHEITGAPIETLDVPVVGGHAGATILPLFSQVDACKSLTAEQIVALDKHVQDAGTDVVNAKAGKGSATLSMAYAGAKFGNAVLCGLAGVDTTECAYVMRGSGEELPYLASKVTFGQDGVKDVHGFGPMNAYEQGRLKEALAQLKDEIAAGLDYSRAQELAVEKSDGSFVVAIPATPTPPPVQVLSRSPKKAGSFKVCVCGGAGGIGQPLCLLMAENPHVSELCVFDLHISMVPAPGVAADLSHLERKSRVKGYSLDVNDKPAEKLAECLTGCDLVLVPAGLPRRPGMTRADLLGVNAGIAKNIVEACARYCPNAVVGLIVNPVNSVVPAMCELYERAGLDPRKICGVTSLDIVRANKFVHEVTGAPIETLDVPVVGGHAGATILPLFSQVDACKSLTAEQIVALDKHVQDAGTDVVNAKAGKGSATLSMAYAGAKFGNAVLCGLAGQDTTECAYVRRDLSEKAPLPYLASKVTFGKVGVAKVHPIVGLSSYEDGRYKECLDQLKGEIDAGLEYAKANSLAVPGNFKVCVCGGAGGIGQPLSLLMARNPNVSELCVYDLTLAMVPAAGVAADLAHLERKSKVKGFALDKDDKPADKLAECLTGCDLVLVPAGMPRKPGMNRADLLGVNAGIAKNIVEACAKFCPNAVVGLIVNPVNSVVPAMCELYKKAGLDPRKICGVTSLDIVRANKFVHEVTGAPIETLDVPVVGGHAGATILPLFSQVDACKSLTAEQIVALDKHVQDAGTDVVNAKAGKGSATLSMAYAGAKFGNAVLCGLAGQDTTECAYVMRGSGEELPYLASKVTFGSTGVKDVHGFGPMNAYEQDRLKEALAQLKEEIAAGVAYASGNQLAVEVPANGSMAAIPANPTPLPLHILAPSKKATGSFKVCVCGGAGGIGQPLCLLMAENPHVSELCVFDLTLAMVPAAGVAADLSHLERKCKVKGYALAVEDKPIDKLGECLTGCHLVLVPAGMPRRPGMTRADLLGVNAGIAKNIVEACGKYCPDAVVGLIVNPVNSVVPAMCELYKKAGLNPRKICGVTSLDIVRANKFVHEITGVNVESIDVPVVGGHAGATILPLFSKVPAASGFSQAQIEDLDKHVQDAGTDVVNAKGGKGSATLSMAYAGAKFGNAVLCGLAGEPTTECAYVLRDDEGAPLPYLASKVTFGSGGVEKVHPIEGLSPYEQKRFDETVAQLKDEIEAGLQFAATSSSL